MDGVVTTERGDVRRVCDLDDGALGVLIAVRGFGANVARQIALGRGRSG